MSTVERQPEPVMLDMDAATDDPEPSENAIPKAERLDDEALAKAMRLNERKIARSERLSETALADKKRRVRRRYRYILWTYKKHRGKGEYTKFMQEMAGYAHSQPRRLYNAAKFLELAGLLTVANYDDAAKRFEAPRWDWGPDFDLDAPMPINVEYMEKIWYLSKPDKTAKERKIAEDALKAAHHGKDMPSSGRIDEMLGRGRKKGAPEVITFDLGAGTPDKRGEKLGLDEIKPFTLFVSVWEFLRALAPGSPAARTALERLYLAMRAGRPVDFRTRGTFRYKPARGVLMGAHFADGGGPGYEGEGEKTKDWEIEDGHDPVADYEGAMKDAAKSQKWKHLSTTLEFFEACIRAVRLGKEEQAAKPLRLASAADVRWWAELGEQAIGEMEAGRLFGCVGKSKLRARRNEDADGPAAAG